MWYFLAAVVIFFIAYRAKKLGYFDKKDHAQAGVVVGQGALFPCIIEGSVDAPPMQDRVNALAIEAASKGLTITGDYAADARAQCGEMMLIGSGFKFVFDGTGQIVKGESRLNLFLTDYPVEGGMAPDGSLGMAVDVGGAKVGVKGRVVDGKFVDGEVRKGWLPHIYGVLNGEYKRL
jgi:hypothetical protein